MTLEGRNHRTRQRVPDSHGEVVAGANNAFRAVRCTPATPVAHRNVTAPASRCTHRQRLPDNLGVSRHRDQARVYGGWLVRPREVRTLLETHIPSARGCDGNLRKNVSARALIECEKRERRGEEEITKESSFHTGEMFGWEAAQVKVNEGRRCK